MNRVRTTRRQNEQPRHAAMIVEAAIVLPVVLTGLFVMLDLGMAVAQSNSLADCARHAARVAIVRGAGSAEPLGPTSWTGTVNESHALAEAVRPRLLAMSADEVTLSVTWPDGSNEPGRRVQVSLRHVHPPLLLSLLRQVELTGQSTMRILR